MSPVSRQCSATLTWIGLRCPNSQPSLMFSPVIQTPYVYICFCVCPVMCAAIQRQSRGLAVSDELFIT